MLLNMEIMKDILLRVCTILFSFIQGLISMHKTSFKNSCLNLGLAVNYSSKPLVSGILLNFNSTLKSFELNDSNINYYPY